MLSPPASSSVDYCWNRWAFRWRLKEQRVVSGVLRSAGRLFHVRGPLIAKLRWPVVADDSVTYFPLKFHNCVHSDWALINDSIRRSGRNFHQRVSWQYTVNANELAARALTGSFRFRICIRYGLDLRLWSLSVTNTFTDSLTYRHSGLYISTECQLH